MQEYKPEVRVFDDIDELNHRLSLIVKKQLDEKPNSAFLIAAGNTLVGMFDMLSEWAEAGEIDFTKAKFALLDEYWFKKSAPRASTLERTKQAFFNRINLTDEQIISFNGYVDDVEAEIERVQSILKANPIDLCVMGIGPGKTCHLGLNDPGSDENSRCRLQKLSDESVEALKAKLNLSDEEVPREGLTVGIGDILDSKKIILVAMETKKAWGINRTLTGEISADAPASFLRLHPEVEVILDKDAASLLQSSTK